MRLIDADYIKKFSHRDEWNNAVIDVEDIDNAPTVGKDRYHEGYSQGYVDGHTNASSVEGTWIYKQYSYYCSNCNKSALELEDYPYLSAYCPFCGAKMEVKND